LAESEGCSYNPSGGLREIEGCCLMNKLSKSEGVSYKIRLTNELVAPEIGWKRMIVALRKVWQSKGGGSFNKRVVRLRISLQRVKLVASRYKSGIQRLEGCIIKGG